MSSWPPDEPKPGFGWYPTLVERSLEDTLTLGAAMSRPVLPLVTHVKAEAVGNLFKLGFLFDDRFLVTHSFRRLDTTADVAAALRKMADVVAGAGVAYTVAPPTGGLCLTGSDSKIQGTILTDNEDSGLFIAPNETAP